MDFTHDSFTAESSMREARLLFGIPEGPKERPWTENMGGKKAPREEPKVETEKRVLVGKEQVDKTTDAVYTRWEAQARQMYAKMTGKPPRGMNMLPAQAVERLNNLATARKAPIKFSLGPNGLESNRLAQPTGYVKGEKVDAVIPGDIVPGRSQELPPLDIDSTGLPEPIKNELRGMPPEMRGAIAEFVDEMGRLSPEDQKILSAVVDKVMALGPDALRIIMSVGPDIVRGDITKLNLPKEQLDLIKPFIDRLDAKEKQLFEKLLVAAGKVIRQLEQLPQGRGRGGPERGSLGPKETYDTIDAARRQKIDRYAEKWRNAKTEEDGMIAEGILSALGVDVDASDLKVNPPNSKSIVLLDLDNESKEDRLGRQFIAGLKILYGLFRKLTKNTEPLSEEEMNSRKGKKPEKIDEQLGDKKKELKDKKGKLKEVNDRLENIGEKLKDTKLDPKDRAKLEDERKQLEGQREKLKKDIDVLEKEVKKLEKDRDASKDRPPSGSGPEAPVSSGKEHNPENTKKLRDATIEAAKGLETAKESGLEVSKLLAAYDACIETAQSELVYLQEFQDPKPETAQRIAELQTSIQGYRTERVGATGKNLRFASDKAGKDFEQAKNDSEKASALKSIVKAYDEELAHLNVHGTPTDERRVQELTGALLEAKKQLAAIEKPDHSQEKEKQFTDKSEKAREELKTAKASGLNTREKMVSVYDNAINASHEELSYYAEYQNVDPSGARGAKMRQLATEIATWRKEKVLYLTTELQKESVKAETDYKPENQKEGLRTLVKAYQQELDHLQTYEPGNPRIAILQANLRTRRQQLAAVESGKALPDSSPGKIPTTPDTGGTERPISAAEKAKLQALANQMKDVIVSKQTNWKWESDKDSAILLRNAIGIYKEGDKYVVQLDLSIANPRMTDDAIAEARSMLTRGTADRCYHELPDMKKLDAFVQDFVRRVRVA